MKVLEVWCIPNHQIRKANSRKVVLAYFVHSRTEIQQVEPIEVFFARMFHQSFVDTFEHMFDGVEARAGDVGLVAHEHRLDNVGQHLLTASAWVEDVLRWTRLGFQALDSVANRWTMMMLGGISSAHHRRQSLSEHDDRNQ